MSWLDKILTEMKGAVAPEPENEGLFGGAVEAPPKDPMAKYIDPVESNRSLLDFILPNKKPKGGSGRGQVNPPIAGSVTQKVDSVFNNLIQAESTGVHQTKDGKLLESPRGALGVTQVMRKTGADPGYGVAPLKDQSREEYLRFGKDLLTAYTNNYDGDIAKGLAAYNTGPGNLNKIIKKHGDSWRNHLSTETKNYLNKIIGK